ncbi:uncharacterized protein LOC118384382 [Oncorhynchus keta]|uniref:uncharacterized protein LOC118384382 n=1 Tax=Oncorhynchus keta TaxID=8018 RepID=UPI00227B0E3D|nr:uncharacterized protein LOC118384382 [Oncorhynchus keta]
MLIQQAGARKEQEQQRRLRRRGGAKKPADQVEARIRQMHCLLHSEKDEEETTLEKKPANNQYSLQWGQRVQGWGKITGLLLLMTYMLRQTSLTEALHSGTPKYHLQNGNNSSLKSMPIQMEAQSSQRRELQGKEQKGRPHKKEEKEESRRLKKRISPQLTFQILNGPRNRQLKIEQQKNNDIAMTRATVNTETGEQKSISIKRIKPLPETTFCGWTHHQTKGEVIWDPKGCGLTVTKKEDEWLLTLNKIEHVEGEEFIVEIARTRLTEGSSVTVIRIGPTPIPEQEEPVTTRTMTTTVAAVTKTTVVTTRLMSTALTKQSTVPTKKPKASGSGGFLLTFGTF